MPIAADGDGVRLRVRVTPRAGRTALAGIAADQRGRPVLAVRLRAPPVDGAANKALIAFLAAGLGLPRSRLAIVSGETGRIKMIAIAGIAPEAVSRWIESAGPSVP